MILSVRWMYQNFPNSFNFMRSCRCHCAGRRRLFHKDNIDALVAFILDILSDVGISHPAKLDQIFQSVIPFKSHQTGGIHSTFDCFGRWFSLQFIVKIYSIRLWTEIWSSKVFSLDSHITAPFVFSHMHMV